MNCPNGWECNEDCRYLLTKERTWEEEEEKVNLQEIAIEVEKDVAQKARSAAEKLMEKTGDEFWQEFYGYRASNLHEKPVNPLDGQIVLGGGSKSGKKKSKKGNKPTVYVWGETL